MATSWKWLDDITPESMQTMKVPMKDILTDSVYYPASGIDGRPVQYLGKITRSFVYVDQSISFQEQHEAFIKEGFKGYTLLGERKVQEKEITPKPPVWHETPSEKDGDPQKYRKDGWEHIFARPYALWTVWERCEKHDYKQGPQRFSLFILCGDGVASFDALYYYYQLKPLALCIIAPGTGFGLNWTDFRQPRLILHRLVMKNPAGIPECILQEKPLRDEKGCYWPEYSLDASHYPTLTLFCRVEEIPTCKNLPALRLAKLVSLYTGVTMEDAVALVKLVVEFSHNYEDLGFHSSEVYRSMLWLPEEVNFCRLFYDIGFDD